MALGSYVGYLEQIQLHTGADISHVSEITIVIHNEEALLLSDLPILQRFPLAIRQTSIGFESFLAYILLINNTHNYLTIK